MALLTRLCVSNNCLLFDEPNSMQVGLRMRLHAQDGGTLLCQIYYGNRYSQNVTVNTKTLSTPAGLAMQAQPSTLTIEAGKQSIQNVQLKCTAPFSEAPKLEIRWTANNTENVLQAKLPFIMTKFVSVRAVPSEQYMGQWQSLTQEAQQIINLRKPMDKTKIGNVLEQGLHMQVIPVSVGKPNDILAAGTLTLSIQKQGTNTFLSAAALLRIQINDDNTIIKVTSKSKNKRICESLNSNLKEVFGPRS